MNPNTWNIKEILSVPPASGGLQKASSLSNAASDYSSLTDSQFLFGSQFWPDQSQGLSQEINFPSRTLQQSSEVNERRVSTTYQTKPYLFGGDSQDNSKVLALTNSKNKGMLERFEEDKRKTKERDKSDILADRVLQLGDSMENMKLTLNSIDGSIESARRIVLEHLDGLSATIQDHAVAVQKSVEALLESLLDKLASQTQKLRDMEDREAKMGVEMSALHSSMQSLRQDLESLRAGHSEERCMMGDILSQFSVLVSSHRLPVQMADGAVQTSPCLFEKLCLISKKTRYFEGMHLCGSPEPFALGEMEDLGRKVAQAGDADTPTEDCFSNISTAGASKEPWQKLCYTRSASTRGAGNKWHRVRRNPRCARENAPHKAVRSLQSLSCQDKRAGEWGIRKMPHGHKKVYPCRRALRRRSRARPSESGKVWSLPTAESAGLCQGGDKGQVQPKSRCALQGLTGYSKATSVLVTSKPQNLQIPKITPQNESLWQLFTISDDSD